MRKSLSCIACVLVGGLLLAIPGCGGGTAATGRDPGNGNGGSGNGGGGSGNGGSSGGGGTGLGGSVFFDSGTGGTTGGAGGAGAGGAGMSGVMKLQRADTNVPVDTQNKLLAGGADTGGMSFLYPYDQTVFPGGILAPLVQWTPASGSIDAVYVHIQGAQFIYDEIFGAQQGAQLPLPQDAFDLVTQQAQGKTDPVTVQLTTSSGGTVSGPITQHWIIARGQLNSAIYYNTYNSPQVMPANGAVMRILPKAAKPEVYKTDPMGSAVPLPTGPCFSCHSLSADGQTLVAQRHRYVSLDTVPYWSESYDIKANANPNPTAMATTNTGTAPMNQADQDWGFSAVYPDGSLLLTDAVSSDSSAATGGTFPFDKTSNPGMIGPTASHLVNPRTGTNVTTNGLVQYAKMPSFSPNGGKVVFNDFDNGQGHSLSVMDFNGTDTFSNRAEVFKDANQWPGWPFLTPDDSAVIFSLAQATASDGTPASDFATVQDPPIGAALNRADLYIADLSTHTARPLGNASGANLPMGDQHSNYYPTVSPVQAGGYFWVFFTTKRTYGNVQPAMDNDPKTKKIWVSAIDIEAVDGKFSSPPSGDPSHPAFYLPGQELESGNIRAFATLTPCKADDMNNACTSPLDCCGGHCIDGLCKTPAVPPMCAALDEKCATTDDCCKDGPARLYCLGGRCGIIVPK